jgi:C_GCAxxG_C_C family probable redox protein
MAGDVVERAYRIGKQYEADYHGCAQCVLAALQDAFDERDDSVFQAATGLSGGGGGGGDGSCGAYAGAGLFIGQMLGRTRDDFTDAGGVRHETARLVLELRERFIDRYGSVVCGDIQTSVIGRPYDLTDPDDVERFKATGAHEVHCPEVVGSAARWAAEIVVANGLNQQDS